MTEPRVVVVGCGAAKLNRPAPARDLYTGTHFRLARDAAVRDGRPWFIVSARYGLLAPGDVVAPYDVRLGVHTDTAAVADLIRANPRGMTHAEVWAPSAYAAALTLAGITVTEPLAGLRIGKRNRWFTEHAQWRLTDA